MAVDAAGKVWAVNLDGWLHRIDPATNTVDLSKFTISSGGHYGYSDMTGIIARNITTKLGTWTVAFNSETPDTPWAGGAVSWNSEPEGSEPDGTSITVKVRSSNDGLIWSLWEDAGNGVPLSLTPDGQYLEIQSTLQILEGDVSPVLSDLSVIAAGPKIDKEITSGPDEDGVGGIDKVVEIVKPQTTPYDFTLSYGGPEVLIIDTVPSEWDVVLVNGVAVVDGSSGGPQDDGAGGTVQVIAANQKQPDKSATKIYWQPQAYVPTSLVIWVESRPRPSKKEPKFAPTSCGILYLNEDGAKVYECDPFTGDPLRDELGKLLPPILVSNPLKLVALSDFGDDGIGQYDGLGDEDGDGLIDWEEVYVHGTDPCNPDTDGDGVPDGEDPAPLDPAVPSSE